MPPMDYNAGTFDFIFSVSVFTHFDETMQFAWLKELKRISKPGGILILTVHGNDVSLQKPGKQKILVAEKGFSYSVVQTGRFKLDGLPDFYQSTQHSREYIEDTWSYFFKIVKYVKNGMNSQQDAVILLNSRSNV
jgi:SAM-dependent methyltransferase